MKKLLIAFLIAAGIFFTATSPALAVKHAVFPDGTQLQPIPTYVHANVSGNINSSLRPAFQNPQNQNSAGVSSPSTPTIQKNVPDQGTPGGASTSGSSGLAWPIIYTITGLLALAWIFWMFKKSFRQQRYQRVKFK